MGGFIPSFNLANVVWRIYPILRMTPLKSKEKPLIYKWVIINDLGGVLGGVA